MEEPAHYLESPRVLWGAAALTIAAAVVAVLAVREVAVRILHPDPAFTPLSPGSPIVATIVCTMMATYVFVGMVSYPNPVRTWRRTSAVVVILSFAPCLLLGEKLLDSTSRGWDHRTRRVWSLLDVLRSHGDAYVRIGKMYEEYLIAFTLTPDPDKPPSDQQFAHFVELLSNLRDLCVHQHLEVSAITLNRTIEEFARSRPDNALALQRINEWFSGFTSELESRLFLLVLPHRVAYWNSGPQDELFFGEQVAALRRSLNDFPEAVYEAGEAGNCLAFERFSAAMYHLMRCVEFGLVSVAKAANASDEKITKGWDGCLQEIHSHIKTLGSTKPPDWQNSVKTFSDLAAWFESIQRGWRNPSSHIPRIYSEQTTVATFAATRTLFEHLTKYGFKQAIMPRDPLTP